MASRFDGLTRSKCQQNEMAVEMPTGFSPHGIYARYEKLLDIAFQRGFDGLFPEQNFSSLGGIQPFPGNDNVDLFRMDAISLVAEGMQLGAVQVANLVPGRQNGTANLNFDRHGEA